MWFFLEREPSLDVNRIESDKVVCLGCGCDVFLGSIEYDPSNWMHHRDRCVSIENAILSFVVDAWEVKSAKSLAVKSWLTADRLSFLLYYLFDERAKSTGLKSEFHSWQWHLMIPVCTFNGDSGTEVLNPDAVNSSLHRLTLIDQQAILLKPYCESLFNLACRLPNALTTRSGTRRSGTVEICGHMALLLWPGFPKSDLT